jgi:preprotein translocase subunit SecG
LPTVRDFVTWLTAGINLLALVAMVGGILLHSGRGGGLSDMFGGGVSSAGAGSTMVERNLDRITVAAGVAWAFTTAILAIRLQ